jgi:hypothetical protein
VVVEVVPLLLHGQQLSGKIPIMKPQIVIESNSGFHNNNPDTIDRLQVGRAYEDVSTVCIVPSRGMISAKVVQNWMSLMSPMNQKFIRIFMLGMEVGEAYSSTIDMIVNHPELSNWKYVLTLEDDNMPPPDGLIKLIESVPGYGAIGALYYTKGEGGQPMIYGNPNVFPKNFTPQVPRPETVQECNGLGMGFTLFSMEMFKDLKKKNMPKPWFKTEQSFTPGVGAKAYTQDLYFFENAAKYGYKFACDTRVKVGHYDKDNDIVW